MNQAAFTHPTQVETGAGVTPNPDGRPSVLNTWLRAIVQTPIFVIAVGLLALGVIVALRKSHSL